MYFIGKIALKKTKPQIELFLSVTTNIPAFTQDLGALHKFSILRTRSETLIGKVQTAATLPQQSINHQLTSGAYSDVYCNDAEQEKV
jgi:hypothetical protein